MRYYETFYGIHTNHWVADFGDFSNHHKILVKDYISEGTSCEESSLASGTYEFLYAHHIKKIYFIEGVITGSITIAANEEERDVTSFRVTVCKVDDSNNRNELFSTGWKTVNDTLVVGNGYEGVYYFEIEAWEKEKLTEHERIYLKVEVNSDVRTLLMHANDAEWTDVNVTLPLIL